MVTVNIMALTEVLGFLVYVVTIPIIPFKHFEPLYINMPRRLKVLTYMWFIDSTFHSWVL